MEGGTLGLGVPGRGQMMLMMLAWRAGCLRGGRFGEGARAGTDDAHDACVEGGTLGLGVPRREQMMLMTLAERIERPGRGR